MDPVFVVVHRYAIVDGDGDRVELSTWTIGRSEAGAKRAFNSSGRALISSETVAGGLPRVKIPGGRGGKTPNDWSVTGRSAA